MTIEQDLKNYSDAEFAIKNALEMKQGVSTEELMRHDLIVKSLLKGLPIVTALNKLLEQKQITKIEIENYTPGGHIFRQQFLFFNETRINVNDVVWY